MEQSINTAAVLTAVSRMGDQDTLNLLPPSAAIMWSPTISNVLSGVLSGELSSVTLDELMHSFAGYYIQQECLHAKKNWFNDQRWSLMLEQRHLMVWKHRLTLEGNYHAVCWASLVFDHSLCALYWASLKASWAFSSCRGRCCLVKSRNPGQDSQDWPSSSHHILQDYQSRNSHSHSLDIAKKL